MPRKLATLAIALILATGSGCSFVLVKGPPTFPRSTTIDCTSSRTWPIIDTAMTVVAAAGGAATLAAGISDDNKTTTAIGAGVMVLAIPYAIGAVVGFKRTTQCRVYKHLWRKIPPG